MDCKERYADSLLCCDVLDIHVYVKARLYKTWHIAEYTMILGGTYDAGRFDSYSEVQLICFSKASSNFAIKNNTIQPLAQQVRGKCDTGWFTYLLKFQDHCPELCYLRHLLVFVHCMNLESAAEDTHLFPDKATLMKHTPDSPVETYTGDASYLEGLDWLRKRVMENPPNPLDLYVGMHSLRVTFYFWAVLCKTPRPIMKENARHKSESMVAKYEGNALHIQKSLEQNPSLYAKQRLGQPQEDLLVTGVASQSISVNGISGSHNHISTLPDAAKLFVEKMLHVPSTDARYRNPSYLLDLSYSKPFTANPPEDQHFRSIVESLPLESRSKVIKAYNLHPTTTLPTNLGITFGNEYLHHSTSTLLTITSPVHHAQDSQLASLLSL